MSMSCRVLMWVGTAVLLVATGAVVANFDFIRERREGPTLIASNGPVSEERIRRKMTADGGPQGDQGSLELEKRVPLGTVLGRIDHLAVDLVRKRLFIAELENNSVSVVDLGNGSLL